MLNQTGITKVSATTRKTILIAPELAFSLSCKVANTGVNAGDDGKKIILAGTPIKGNLSDRDGVDFVVDTTSPTGLLLHDLDVTSGTKNAQVLIFGFVDESKLESSVAALVTTAKANLPKITFVK